MSSDNRVRGVIPLRAQQDPGRRLLTRDSPQVRVGGRGVLQANLNWLPGARADVNLCCLIKFRDGTATCVQSLGDNFGALDAWPYVALDQDDRTGASADGETLRVGLGHRERFEKLLFFVYIYEGSADFRRLGASVTVTEPSGPGCRILLDDSPAGSVGCAIALVTPDAGGLTVRREVSWFTGTATAGPHEKIDRAYGFGLDYTVTLKPPRDQEDRPARGGLRW